MIPTESAITLRILKERSWIVKQLVEIRARKVVESANRRKAIETNKNPVIMKHV